MGSQTLNIYIENLFNTQWAALNPTVTIKFDNIDFTVPDNAAWVALEVWEGESTKASIGAGTQLRRTTGTAFVTIYVPKSTGSKTARGYADQVKGIFRDVYTANFVFFEGSVSRLGEVYYASTGGGTTGTAQWYQMKVAIPFMYNEYL